MENISLFALNERVRCRRGFELNGLHLNYSGGVSAHSVVKKALQRLKCGWVDGREMPDVLREVEGALLDYPVEEGELKASAELARKKVYRRIEAMATYLWAQEGKRQKDVKFRFELNGIVYEDEADIVIGEGDDARVVMFDHWKSPYSSRAKIPENHSSRCPGVVLLAAAGYRHPEVWYLTSKDEKGDAVPPFEVKAEKNIVRAVIPKEEAERCLAEMFASKGKEDCANCRHSPVCRLKEVRTEKKEDGTAAKPQPVFTEQQQKAVEFKDGAMALIAVPGAGKTTVLVHRLLNLLEDGVPAGEILFITFTKKAANEIRERIARLLPEGAEKPAVQTFNSFGYTLLREHPALVGRHVRIADENDTRGMVLACLEKWAADGKYLKNMGYAGACLEYGLVNRIHACFKDIDTLGEEGFAAKNAGKSVDVPGVVELHKEYGAVFQAGGYITFDEQVSLVNRMFERHPELVGKVSEKYRYIMVDEFQDANGEQAKMVYSIAKRHGNIVVVGDDDQSIYGWRGGSNEYLLNFKRDFPSAEVVILNDNFRSNDKILNAADSVIRLNEKRYGKSLRGHRAAQYAPAYFKAGAEKIAEIVPQMLKAYRPGDIAVLARTNKRLGEVESALDGVVKTATPKDYLAEDAVFEIIYDAVTLFYSLDNDVALFRCLTRLNAGAIPACGFGESLYGAVRRSEPGFVLDRLDMNAMLGYRVELSPLLLAGKKILTVLKKMQYYRSLDEVFGVIAAEFGFSPDHKACAALSDICDDHAFSKLSELYAYMREMVLFRSTLRVGYDASEDAVNLLTAHDSKGKEFPVVILYGTEEFSSQSEEDNCLLYVAMTRAKNTLVMIEGEHAAQSVLSVGNVKDNLIVK